MNSLSTHLESVVLPYLSTSALYSTYKDDPLCINIIMEISCLFVAITSTLPHTASYGSFFSPYFQLFFEWNDSFDESSFYDPRSIQCRIIYKQCSFFTKKCQVFSNSFYLILMQASVQVFGFHKAITQCFVCLFAIYVLFLEFYLTVFICSHHVLFYDFVCFSFPYLLYEKI